MATPSCNTDDIVPSPASPAPEPIGTSGVPANAPPFSVQQVILSKQEYIELISQARYWKSVHDRMSGRSNALLQEIKNIKAKAHEREAQLLAELAVNKAMIRDLRQRLFGTKTEGQATHRTPFDQCPKSQRHRGQQRASNGHGRTRLTDLPSQEEIVELTDLNCPRCGLALKPNGCEDSEVIEVSVNAYRRIIHRQRYRCACKCSVLPGSLTAPAPARLINKGKFGISVWTTVLLDKFLYGRPSSRLLDDLRGHGLRMSAGSLAGGLRRIASLFAPLQAPWLKKLRSEPHWHADETRWEVFCDHEGKQNHRCYLWVFQSRSALYYVVDPTRSASVPKTVLAGVEQGIISCDRYSAYQAHARQHPGIQLAFCWAHQRRDFIVLANSYPELWSWSMHWIGQIAELYRLHKLRAQTAINSSEYLDLDVQVHQALQDSKRAANPS